MPSWSFTFYSSDEQKLVFGNTECIESLRSSGRRRVAEMNMEEEILPLLIVDTLSA